MTITGETIKSAVSIKLATTYPTISIRKETIQQGSERPFFYVSQIDMTQWKESSNKYKRLYQIKITYQVDINDTETNEKLDEIGSQLMDLFTTIDVECGDGTTTYPVFGTQMDYKIVDDVMQFFVSFPIRVYKDLPKSIKQQQLKINTNGV